VAEPAAPHVFHVDEAARFIGREVAVSDWMTIDQARVSAFADATIDHDWMHTDAARSRAESPYQGTIVQGFLMMSLVIRLHHATGLVPGGTAYGLNYGMDRVRFTSVLPTGSRVRDRIRLKAFAPRGEGFLMTTEDTLEVEGQAKPAMVADWLTLWYRA
jgi:acyl dehydratase